MAVGRRTSDDGLENWERLTLDPVAADDAFVYLFTILPSGKIIAMLSNKIIASVDEGASWELMEGISAWTFQKPGLYFLMVRSRNGSLATAKLMMK